MSENLSTQERLDGLLAAIAGGDGDDDIEAVYTAVEERHKFLEAQEGAMVISRIKVGDTVSFKDGRPKYLQGLQAKVISLGKTRAVVQVVEQDRHYAKRFGLAPIRAPYSSLEIVS